MRSPEEQLQWEVNAYGMPRAELLGHIENSITAKFGGVGMVVLSMMSDMQEMLERNESGTYTERLRQNLNVCKMLIAEFKLGLIDRDDPAPKGTPEAETEILYPVQSSIRYSESKRVIVDAKDEIIVSDFYDPALDTDIDVIDARAALIAKLLNEHGSKT